jgi:hypothetical protein
MAPFADGGCAGAFQQPLVVCKHAADRDREPGRVQTWTGAGGLVLPDGGTVSRHRDEGGHMPQQQQQQDARALLVAALMEKVEEDQYPSTTMLDMLEELMTPEEMQHYVEVLTERIGSDRFPSIPMLQRLQNLV